MTTNKDHRSSLKSPAMLATVAGLILVMAGTAIPLLQLHSEIYKYIFSVGAILVVVGRLFMPYTGSSLRIKRLCRLEVWSGLFFCAAAFFMFWHGAGPTDWIAFTLAGAAIQIYTSIMIPRTRSKEQGK
ncbi:MAG: hypothetical protein K2O88_02365 [Paramuribaculum sp.]|nr:hypothetical protein [Paramuribaculum sp.]